jgi:homoserine kinase type II
MAAPDWAAGPLALWGIRGDAEFSFPERGTNNKTLLVTQGERRWVLRISQNLSAAQVRAEHRLLARLRQSGLPFSVPEPVPALTGETVAQTAAGPATFCRWIRGVRPDLTDEQALVRFGVAIGAVSDAMRLLPLDDAPQDWRDGPLRMLPDDVDVDGLGRELTTAGVSREHSVLLTETAQAVAMRWRAAASAGQLAIQIVHGDLGASNTLVDESTGQVTGLLDFEIAGADFRVQDLVAGLLLSGALAGRDWQVRAAALIRGAASVICLGDAELQAVPELLMCRSVGSALWRACRWRRGQASLGEVTDRLHELDASLRWLALSGGRLLALLDKWGR